MKINIELDKDDVVWLSQVVRDEMQREIDLWAERKFDPETHAEALRESNLLIERAKRVFLQVTSSCIAELIREEAFAQNTDPVAVCICGGLIVNGLCGPNCSKSVDDA
jgi:hypothetical protein